MTSTITGLLRVLRPTRTSRPYGHPADLATNGQAVAVDPALAREMGAFVEDTLSPEAALSKPLKPGKQNDVGAFVEDALSVARQSQPRKSPRKGPGKGDGGLGR